MSNEIIEVRYMGISLADIYVCLPNAISLFEAVGDGDIPPFYGVSV